MKLYRALRLAPLALGLLSLAPACVFAQPAPSEHAAMIENAMPVFDLDFPGGTPAELIAAINKASARPLNAIIAPEYATRKLPPIKVHDVDAAQLFAALIEVQRGSTRINGTEYHNRSSFMTGGQPSNRSIWVFSVGPEEPVARTVTRLFPLAYYLQYGLTADDITTAIRTSWEMGGDAQTPTIKFHQETQLLVAAGQLEQLAVIDDVLEALKTTVRVRAEAAEKAAAQAPHASH